MKTAPSPFRWQKPSYSLTRTQALGHITLWHLPRTGGDTDWQTCNKKLTFRIEVLTLSFPQWQMGIFFTDPKEKKTNQPKPEMWRQSSDKNSNEKQRLGERWYPPPHRQQEGFQAQEGRFVVSISHVGMITELEILALQDNSVTLQKWQSRIKTQNNPKELFLHC